MTIKKTFQFFLENNFAQQLQAAKAIAHPANEAIAVAPHDDQDGEVTIVSLHIHPVGGEEGASLVGDVPSDLAADI